jgi:hypothetical protein
MSLARKINNYLMKRHVLKIELVKRHSEKITSKLKGHSFKNPNNLIMHLIKAQLRPSEPESKQVRLSPKVTQLPPQ